MYKFSSVIEKLPAIRESRMVSAGYGVWLAYTGALSSSISQTFTDYGGILVAEDSGQALWFFFHEDVFRALARLLSWATVSTMPVFAQVIPVSLLVGYKLERSLSVPAELGMQTAVPPDNLEVWIHPKFAKALTPIPGLELKKSHQVAGMAKADWQQLASNPSLGYEPAQAWYCIFKPLGDPLDKDSFEGWRNIMAEAQTIFAKLQIKHIVQDGFVLFQLDSLRQLKTWCLDVQAMLSRLKSEEDGKRYWPCVMAIVRKLGQNIKELPRRVNLDWNQLSPDFTYLQFRTAFLVEDEFRINTMTYSSQSGGVDDWCYVSPAEKRKSEAAGAIELELPFNLLKGTSIPCFYCGLRNHDPAACPTKGLADIDLDVWAAIGGLGVPAMNEKLAAMDAMMASDPVGSTRNLLSGSGEESLLARGIMAVAQTGQLRFLARVWRAQGKIFPQGILETGPRDQGFHWTVLDALRAGDKAKAQQLLAAATANNERSMQSRGVQGFAAMEEGDWTNAIYYWQEAQRMSESSLTRSYHLFLQARALEVQGEVQKAMALYKLAQTDSPFWHEPSYRLGVCMVKMAFPDQGMLALSDLYKNEWTIFNRILLDPEMERGRIRALEFLWRPFTEAQRVVLARSEKLGEVDDSLKSWFTEDNNFLRTGEDHLAELRVLAQVPNYVAFKRFLAGYTDVELEIKRTVEKETRVLQARIKFLFDELREIQREAAWFPFPKLLIEFNRDFNYCAAKLNWMRTSSLGVAENFKKSTGYVTEVEDQIKVLKARLVTLRIVRDATLFILMLGRNFIWFELVGIGLALLFVPIFAYVAQKTGQDWMADVVLRQRWQMQKGLMIVLSILAMAGAAIRTALSFESKKQDLFAKEDAKMGASAAKAGKSKKAKKKDQEALPPGKPAPAGDKQAAPALPPGKGKK